MRLQHDPAGARPIGTLLLVALLGLAWQCAHAQARSERQTISVDLPKVYNYATLRARLLGYGAQLDALSLAMQGTDGGILQGLYATQGMEATRSASAVSAFSAPLPGLERTIEIADGKATTSETSTTGERSASAPAATPPNAFQTSGALTASAASRLAEYTNLRYEIMNLRALLERAPSDVYSLSSGAGQKRMPIVLGFNVSLEPPAIRQGCVAEVVVTIEDEGNPGDAPQVSMLMPQEKTYNVSMVTADSRSASLGLVTTLLSIGGSTARSNEKLYLVQDTDTMAFIEGKVDGKSAVRFGWRFRPVLGRPHVTPGIRNLVVALSASRAEAKSLKVEVETFWRPYDAKRRTVGETVIREGASWETEVEVNASAIQPKLDELSFRPAGKELIEVYGHGEGFFAGMPMTVNGRVAPASEQRVVDEQTFYLLVSPEELLSGSLRTQDIFGGEQEITRKTSSVSQQSLQGITATAIEHPDDAYIIMMTVPEALAKAVNDEGHLALVRVADSYFGLDPTARIRFEPTNMDNGGSNYQQAFVVPREAWIASPTVTLSLPFTSADGKALLQTITATAENQGFSLESITLAGTNSENHYFTMVGRGLQGVEAAGPSILAVSEEMAKAFAEVAGKGISRFEPSGIQSLKSDLFTDGFLAELRSGEVALRQDVTISDIAPSTSGSLPADFSDRARRLTVPKSYTEGADMIVLYKAASPEYQAITGQSHFIKVIKLPLKKVKPKTSVQAAVLEVELGHAGAVLFGGEALDRITGVQCGSISLDFTLTAQGEKTLLAVDLPLELTKSTGTRTLILTLDDGSALLAKFKVKAP